MASITLHRASRILDSIAKALKVSEPKTSAKVSIFSQNLEADVTALQYQAAQDLERSDMLFDAREAIRAVVGVANAQTGISALLARKAALEGKIALRETLPGVSSVKPEPEDEMAIYRRRRQKAVPGVVIVPETVFATAAAMKARFQGAAVDGGSSEIEVGTVTANGADHYRKEVVAIRRELDEVSDQLRMLNSSTRIEVPDQYMNWLTTNDVV